MLSSSPCERNGTSPSLVLLTVLIGGIASQRDIASAQAKPAAPRFQVDPSWPLELPNNWILGSVTGVFVDAKQHVWVTHLPETLTEEELYQMQKPPMGTCCAPAPVVLEFDEKGKLVQGWGDAATQDLSQFPQEPARHLRRPQRLRVGRQPRASPRDEVHARRQAGVHDRRVRQGWRQRRHQAPRRPLGHLGRSQDQRSLHLRRLSQPPRDRGRRRDRQVPAALGRLRQRAGRHGEVRSEDDDVGRAAEAVLDAARHHRIEGRQDLRRRPPGQSHPDLRPRRQVPVGEDHRAGDAVVGFVIRDRAFARRRSSSGCTWPTARTTRSGS